MPAPQKGRRGTAEERAIGFKEWSPSALETARTPMTRPRNTDPPAAKMRCRSVASVGLWSRLKDTTSARPATKA